jgi:RNA polymerase sigma factor (sigma-70 family)
MAAKRPERRDRAANEDLVSTYLGDIARYRLLNRDDELRLSHAINAGNAARARLDESPDLPAKERRKLDQLVLAGNKATNVFIQANLRLVVMIAKRYRTSSVPLLDLIQEGNLGLMHAVTKFDGRKGFKFSTYATWWIRQAIARGIANSARTIRLPVDAGDALALVSASRTRLTNDRGRVPTIDELAAETGLPAVYVRQVVTWGRDLVSLSAGVGPEGDIELGDLLADKMAVDPAEAAAESVLVTQMQRMLADRLDAREMSVLRLRFGLNGCGVPRTLEEIGAQFQLSRERIRQIEAVALSKLRDPAFRVSLTG